MPELPDDDPRLQEFASQTLSRLHQLYIGKPLNQHTIRQINTFVDHQRISFKQTYGYDIPELVALILPTSRFIALYRADLDTLQIHVFLTNLMRELGHNKVPVDKLELAQALKLAWPHYDPAIELFANDQQAGKAIIH
jgi:hypothetical protein